MITYESFKTMKVSYDLNREDAKIFALLSGNFDKNEYLKGKDIVPPEKNTMMAQAKFTYYPLGKAFEKQIKTIEEQREKQIKPLTSLIILEKRIYTPLIMK